MSNQPIGVLDRWKKPGDVSTAQRYSTNTSDFNPYNAYSNFGDSNGYIVNASFIRLKNVSLSWQLPSGFIKNAHLSSGRIFMTGQNLLTISNYVGMDPESQNSQTLPPLRMLTAGLQFTF
jgi:hypothetical protein